MGFGGNGGAGCFGSGGGQGAGAAAPNTGGTGYDISWGGIYGYGGHGGGVSLEDFVGGSRVGGGGGYGGGGAGGMTWCNYNYGGGGGGGGGFRSGSILTDFIFNKDIIGVNAGDVLRAGVAANAGGYASLTW
jgi:hypothetical protein